MKNLLVLLLLAVLYPPVYAQTCIPAGNEISYGNSDTWIGYIYDNMNFTSYRGFVNEGVSGNPNFDQGFGGDDINYPVNSCAVFTQSFSARYKLTKTFAPGNYQFIVGGDDGYRLSMDGGATWIIDHWNEQAYNFTAYATTLGGIYNLVLEYYENGGGNRISFSVENVCTGTEDQSVYGTGDTWNGYIYAGTAFNRYTGMVTKGVSGNPNFNENFGGSNTLYSTSSCLQPTEQFSARYRLQKTFSPGDYIFTVGGDDGYRLSLDGGSTWVINRWTDQGYNTTTYSATLTGTHNLVLEYYENGGGNQVSFNLVSSVLPVQLKQFDGKVAGKHISLNWKVSKEINTGYYLVERSTDGIDFTARGKVIAGNTVTATSADKAYGYIDLLPVNGINYYRLRMVDLDGRFSYSPAIKIQFEEKKTVAVFPSVISHTPVYLTTSAVLRNGVVKIYDLTGKKIQATNLPAFVMAGQTITLPLTGIARGSYVLICQAGTDIKAKQIIIVR